MPGDVADLEHLAIRNAGLHERGRDVNHQAEPRKPAATFEEAAQIGSERDAFARDAVNRGAWREHVGLRQRSNAGVVAIVHILANRNRLTAAHDQADLVAERQIDRGRAHLVGFERLDHDAARSDLLEQHVARENRHGARR